MNQQLLSHIASEAARLPPYIRHDAEPSRTTLVADELRSQLTVGAVPQQSISPQFYSMFLETEINFGGGVVANSCNQTKPSAGCVDECIPHCRGPTPNIRAARPQPPQADDFRPWLRLVVCATSTRWMHHSHQSAQLACRLQCRPHGCGRCSNPGYGGSDGQNRSVLRSDAVAGRPMEGRCVS